MATLNYFDFFSPAMCAKIVLDEICQNVHVKDAEKVKRLLEQFQVDIYEHCAQAAEEYVAVHDRDGFLTGEEVGDAIAETLRKRVDRPLA